MNIGEFTHPGANDVEREARRLIGMASELSDKAFLELHENTLDGSNVDKVREHIAPVFVDYALDVAACCSTYDEFLEWVTAQERKITEALQEEALICAKCVDNDTLLDHSVTREHFLMADDCMVEYSLTCTCGHAWMETYDLVRTPNH